MDGRGNGKTESGYNSDLLNKQVIINCLDDIINSTTRLHLFDLGADSYDENYKEGVLKSRINDLIVKIELVVVLINTKNSNNELGRVYKEDKRRSLILIAAWSTSLKEILRVSSGVKTIDAALGNGGFVLPMLQSWCFAYSEGLRIIDVKTLTEFFVDSFTTVKFFLNGDKNKIDGNSFAMRKKYHIIISDYKSKQQLQAAEAGSETYEIPNFSWLERLAEGIDLHVSSEKIERGEQLTELSELSSTLHSLSIVLSNCEDLINKELSSTGNIITNLNIPIFGSLNNKRRFASMTVADKRILRSILNAFKLGSGNSNYQRPAIYLNYEDLPRSSILKETLLRWQIIHDLVYSSNQIFYSNFGFDTKGKIPLETNFLEIVEKDGKQVTNFNCVNEEFVLNTSENGVEVITFNPSSRYLVYWKFVYDLVKCYYDRINS